MWGRCAASCRFCFWRSPQRFHAREMRQEWVMWLKQNRPLSRKYAKTKIVETDSETERQLEALGYVGAQ